MGNNRKSPQLPLSGGRGGTIGENQQTLHSGDDHVKPLGIIGKIAVNNALISQTIFNSVCFVSCFNKGSY